MFEKLRQEQVLQRLKSECAAEIIWLRDAAPERRNAHRFFEQGRKLANAKNFKGAASEFKKAIAADPEFAEAHHNYGLALSSLGRTHEAIDAIRASIALDPQDGNKHYNLGIIEFGVDGLLAESVRTFTHALTINSSLTRAHFWLGVASVRNSDVCGGAIALIQAIRSNCLTEFDFQIIKHIIPQSEELAKVARSAGEDFASLYIFGISVMYTRPQFAIWAFDKIVSSLRPDFLEGYYLLAAAQLNYGFNASAVETYQKIAALSNDDVDAVVNAVKTIFFDLHDTNAARESLAPHVCGNAPDVVKQLADEIDAKKRREDEATARREQEQTELERQRVENEAKRAEQLLRSLKFAGEDKEYEAFRGKLREPFPSVDQSTLIQLLARMLREYDLPATKVVDIGNYFLSANDTLAARVAYEVAIKRDERFPEAHVGLAEVLVRRGKFVEAAESYAVAYKLGLGNADRYQALGKINLELGRFRQAAAAYKRSLRYPIADPGKTAHIHKSLAEIYAFHGKDHLARVHLKAAAKALPRDLEARRGLVVLELANGQVRSASQHLRIAEIGNPNNFDTRLARGLFHWWRDRIELASKELAGAVAVATEREQAQLVALLLGMLASKSDFALREGWLHKDGLNLGFCGIFARFITSYTSSTSLASRNIIDFGGNTEYDLSGSAEIDREVIEDLIRADADGDFMDNTADGHDGDTNVELAGNKAEPLSAAEFSHIKTYGGVRVDGDPVAFLDSVKEHYEAVGKYDLVSVRSHDAPLIMALYRHCKAKHLRFADIMPPRKLPSYDDLSPEERLERDRDLAKTRRERRREKAGLPPASSKRTLPWEELLKLTPAQRLERSQELARSRQQRRRERLQATRPPEPN